VSAKRIAGGAWRVLPLLLATLLLSGCLEEITTTRIAGGAARNFLYYLSHDEQADANSYWAPDHAPTDAADQVKQAATTLRDYEVVITKADMEPQPDGSVDVTVSGRAARKPATPAAAGPVIPLLSAHLIAIGPGWRVTAFTLLCCQDK
jgi:hypothetical protein